MYHSPIDEAPQFLQKLIPFTHSLIAWPLVCMAKSAPNYNCAGSGMRPPPKSTPKNFKMNSLVGKSMYLSFKNQLPVILPHWNRLSKHQFRLDYCDFDWRSWILTNFSYSDGWTFCWQWVQQTSWNEKRRINFGFTYLTPAELQTILSLEFKFRFSRKLMSNHEDKRQDSCTIFLICEQNHWQRKQKKHD